MADDGLAVSEALASLEARFAAANGVPDYASVRDDALRVAATSSGFDAFRARLMAADCRYWSAQMAPRGEQAALLATLPAELADVADAAGDALGRTPRERLEQFASLVDATVRITLADTAGNREATEGFRRLARTVEAAVPDDFVFGEERWKDAWRRRSVVAAAGLGGLSLAHGDEQRGRDRLAAALELSLGSGDIVDHREACDNVYAMLKACWTLRPALVVTVFAVQRAMLETIDRCRATYRSRVGRLWVSQLVDPLVGAFQRDAAEPLLPDIDVAVQPKEAETLFAYLREHLLWCMESNKSRLLLDQLASGTKPFADAAVHADALARERALLALPANDADGDELVKREMQLVSRLPMLFWQDLRQDPQAVRTQSARIAQLEAAFAGQDAGLTHVEGVTDIDTLVDALGEGEAIVEYSIPRDTLHPAERIYMLAITRRGISRHVVQPLDVLKQVPDLYHGDIGALAIGGREPVEESPLGELVFQARLAIQDDTPAARIWLRLLHMLLVDPLVQVGIAPAGFVRWHVVPHGLLHGVPWRALLDNENAFLNDRVALSIAPSASVACLLQDAWKAPERFVAFADPKLDAPWRPLPNTQAEVRSAAKRLGGSSPDVFVQADATLHAFATHAPAASVLHVATHGDFPRSDTIDFHRMLLTPQGGDDGRLTAEILRNTDLHRTQLAVLSVCDGGLHRVGVGDELYGLVAAALEAGVDSVLTTLWRVDDMATRLWMREFYAALAAEGPAVAAKKACATMSANGAAIRDWGGFVLVGGGA